MRPRDLILPILALSALTVTAGLAESLPGVEVSADRSSYLAGQTAIVTLRTHAGGPSDVYITLTTPSGRTLYADPALQFRRRITATATNFMVAEGQVEIPLSLSTSELARPGEYTVEVYVTPPGAGLGGGELAGEARFLVSLPGLNYLAIHNPDSPNYDDDCATCHTDKTRNVSLAPGIPSFHTIKYRMFSAGGSSRACAICHKGADLIDQSQATLRKDTSTEFCAQCHGALGTGTRLFAK